MYMFIVGLLTLLAVAECFLYLRYRCRNLVFETCACRQMSMTRHWWEHNNYWVSVYTAHDGSHRGARGAIIEVHSHPSRGVPCRVV